jgi:Rrf2 family protein
MILRNQVEWVLHCGAVFAGLPPGARIGTKALAEFHGVPKEYLSKALQALATAGIIEGSLGPTGGYRLTRAPKEITFLDLIEAIEGERRTFQCTEIRGNSPCVKKSERPTGICAVARVMYRADEAWRKELRAVSLEDLGKAVIREVPKELLRRNGEWLTERSR